MIKKHIKKTNIPKGCFALLSQLPKDGKLYKNCIEFLLLIDPEKWPKERVSNAIEVLHYEILIFYLKPEKIIGTASFNPDRKDGVAKLFSLFVIPEHREKGLAKILTARFLKWARQNGFEKTQIGKGVNSAATAILKSLKREQVNLGISFAKIDPTTGEVFF